MKDQRTWLPLGKAGPSNDAGQQCAASYKRNKTYICIDNHTEVLCI